MSTTISEYYTGELIDWGKSIISNSEELAELGQKLGDTIRRNSIPDIAKKVEWHQARLNLVADELYKLQFAIQQQELDLKTDNTFIDDSLIDTRIEKKQAELRSGMETAEKDFIDAKFSCQKFLSGTLKK